jgi:hypothetical protein
MFRGFSQCTPLWVYFTLVHSTLSISLLTPLPPTPFFNSFQYTSLCPLPSQMLCFMILLMPYHSLFLSLFPKFHREIPLSPTRSTSEFVCDRAAFWVCAALLTTAKLWKEPRCPTADDWIKNLWSIHTMEFYWAVRNSDMGFEGKWMQLRTSR